MENTIKNFWNNKPCNIGHSNKKFLSKEYFDEITKKRYYVESHIPEFCEFSKYKNKKILEIGCGIGTDAIMFAQEGCEYYAIDLSDESLEITKQRFKIYDLSGYFYNINAENMYIFENNFFDMIYSFGVIHHTENPEKILNEIYRILKPDGELKVMLYAKNSWKKMMIDLNLDQYEAQSNCPIANTYSKNDIYELFKQYSNINIKQYHIFPYKINEYKQNVYVKVDYFDKMPEQIYEKFKSIMGWHLCITCNKQIDIINEDYTLSIYNSPWKHIIINNLFTDKLINKANSEIPDFDNIYWEKAKHFLNEYTNKKEINNINLFPESIKQITNYLISNEFVNKLEKILGFDELIIDNNIYGGGLTISPKFTKLEKHIDFNFNSDINLYRAVNLILYFNDIDGGDFELYDNNLNIKKIISPQQNKILIFASNNNTIHGFNEIISENRKSLNLWYYTKIKPSYVDYKPHKTIWFNNKNLNINNKNLNNKLDNYIEKLEKLFNNSKMLLKNKLNNFTLFVPNNVIAKFLIREQLFKKILNIHGCIIEIGVANGIGISSFQHLSTIYEPYNEHRPLYGFDNFEGFIKFTNEDLTTNSNELFIGNYKSDSEKIINESANINLNFRPIKKDNNITLIKGDICTTIPQFVKNNNHLIIALLYLDCDLYEPTKISLKYLINRMPKGSLIVFDELANNSFPGETQAFDDILGIKNYKIERFEQTKVSYIII
jgi:ubiquinone/menaquinone biosynthesis C-methylase UbiE